MLIMCVCTELEGKMSPEMDLGRNGIPSPTEDPKPQNLGFENRLIRPDHAAFKLTSCLVQQALSSLLPSDKLPLAFLFEPVLALLLVAVIIFSSPISLSLSSSQFF